VHRTPPAAWGLPPGRLRPITRWSDPVLHRPLAPVTCFDEALSQLVADMFQTMAAADGVGLAANQVGVDLAVFVFDLRPDLSVQEPAEVNDKMSEADLTGLAGVACNPVLSTPHVPGQGSDKDSEGCLSLPGAFVPCRRALVAEVSAVDHTGRPVHYGGSGLLARCLQHEADHLRGVVFADLLPGRHRRKLRAQATRLAEQYPDDWPVTAQVPADD
jgi:peptide deformylase